MIDRLASIDLYSIIGIKKELLGVDSFILKISHQILLDLFVDFLSLLSTEIGDGLLEIFENFIFIYS